MIKLEILNALLSCLDIKLREIDTDKGRGGGQGQKWDFNQSG